MFQFPASISFISDLGIVLLYFLKPTVFGDTYSHSWWELLDLYNSFLALVILAVIRILLMASEVYQFQKNNRMIKINTVYGFLLFNVIVVVIKASVTAAHISIFQAVTMLASLLSICCQVVCLRHLKSSVLPVRHVVLGLSLRPLKLHHGLPQHEHPEYGTHSVAVLLNENRCSKAMSSSDGDVESGHLLSERNGNVMMGAQQQPSVVGVGVDEEHEHVSRNHLTVTRGIWHSKIEGIKALVHKMRGGRSNRDDGGIHFVRGTPSSYNPQQQQQQKQQQKQKEDEEAFDLVLVLFVGDAHGDRAVERLEGLFAHYPQEVEFFLPQLTVYLLYGSFGARGLQLKRALLRMCAQSLPFALKFHWFVASFCLSEAGVQGEGVHALMTLTAEIQANGEVAAQQLLADLRAQQSDNDRNSGGAEKESAAHPCYPLRLTRMPAVGDTQYSLSLHFWHEMVSISRTLGATPRPARQQELRRLVRGCVDSYLPSATVHVPFRNTQHRVWAVHADECFAFSSVDRAPVLLILEVVTFGSVRKRDEEDAKWWIPRVTTGRGRRHSRASGSCAGINRFGYKELVSASDDEEEDGHSQKVRVAPTTPPSRTPPAIYYQTEGDVHTSGNSAAYDAYSNLCRPSRSLDIGQWTSPMGPDASHNKHRSLGSSKSKWSGAQSLPASAPIASIVGRSPSKSLLDASLAASRNLGQDLNMEAEPSAAGRLLTTGGGSLSREVVVSDADQVDLNASLVLDPEARPGERSFDRSAMAPSVVFKERWRHKEERIRRDSPVGHLEGWRLVPVIVKSNDDLRQEQCASQLIALMHRILHASDKCGSGLRPYEIIAMSPDSGLIEAIPDTVSLHALRSREFGYDSLLAFFEQYFGPPDSPAFLRAQDHFVKSLADYSIACYLLQIKDRHNGNMLLTTHGHIVHIDFGFLLGKTPGDVGFEKAPFKLTRDFVELMGGEHSKTFHRFRRHCVQSFLELRKHHYRIILLLEMISKGNEHLRCFSGDSKRVIDDMRCRFCPDMHDNAVVEVVHNLIDESLDNWTTTWYDRYQKCFVGVF